MSSNVLNLPSRLGSTMTTAASYNVQHRPRWVQQMVDHFLPGNKSSNKGHGFDVSAHVCVQHIGKPTQATCHATSAREKHRQVPCSSPPTSTDSSATVIQDEQLLQASKQTQAHSQQREQHAADWLQQQQQKQQMCKTDVRSQHHAPKLQLADFIIGRVIGAGSFGRVHLVQNRRTHCISVIKMISKAVCIRDGQVQHVLDERHLLGAIGRLRHPFLVNLQAAFQDKECLHLVLEFVPGGDFLKFLQSFPSASNCHALHEDHARFYAAQIILALECLHAHKIVFRDLKPENILVDCQGYIKVTDLGFAKVVDGVTHTFCGTPDYLAPEVVRGEGHGLAVDYWSLGCVIYEMLHGLPPFYSNGDVCMTYRKILEGIYFIPEHWSPVAKDVITQLLQPDPAKRLGMVGLGIQTLKSHPWFQGYCWDNILAKRYLAPFQPKISNSADTSNFEDFSNLGLMDHPFRLSSEQQAAFACF